MVLKLFLCLLIDWSYSIVGTDRELGSRREMGMNEESVILGYCADADHCG